MPEIMIAVRQGHILIDGRRYIVKPGVTTAHANHPVVRDHPKLWVPIKVHYAMPDDSAFKRTDETAPNGAPGETEPDNATVRAWATQRHLACAPYGKVPAAVMEAYRAAHAAG